jgi:hypothetical protein
MATTPQNYAPSLTFVQSQATAALATWTFRAVNSADSTNATGKTFTMTIGKAGGALAAPNGGTAITELTLGWYKVVHNAADFDTLGALGVHLTASGVDIINTVHQVRAFDQNTATVNPATGSIDAGDFTAAALAAISVPLITVVKTVGPIVAASGDFPISMKSAIDCTVGVTGTFGSGTAQVQTTQDPTVASPVWTNSGSGLTANGSVVVTGPFNAVRVHWTGATSPSITITFTIRKPAGT